MYKGIFVCYSRVMRVTDFGLSALERGFVAAVVSGQADSAADAARIAGYSTPNAGAAGSRGYEVAQRPAVRAAIAAAFAEQGLDEGWVAGRLRTYGEDERVAVRAPAVRSVELAARILGMLEADSPITIDARSIIVPGASRRSIEELEAALSMLPRADGESEPK